MTDHQPPPIPNRPLSGADVELLQEGDVLRVVLPPYDDGDWKDKNQPPLGAEVVCAGSIPYQVCVFLKDYEPGFGWHRSRFMFVSRPSASVQPPPAVEAIGRLEELARAGQAAHDQYRPSIDLPDWFTLETLRSAQVFDEGERAFIAAASPQAILSLISERRHSVEREAGLREALEETLNASGAVYAAFVRDGVYDGARGTAIKGYSTAVRKARAALDRRAGT